MQAAVGQSSAPGAVINAHDPQGVEEARALLPEKVNYFDDVYETVTGAGCGFFQSPHPVRSTNSGLFTFNQ